MTMFTFQRLASSMLVLTLCTGAPFARAQSPEPAAAAPAVAAPTNPSDTDTDADADGATDAEASGHKARPHIQHDPNGDIFNLGRDSTLPEGHQADSVVAILGSVTSNGEAGSVVAILGDAKVTGPVEETVVAVLGSSYIDGKVDGEAVTVLGNLELGPHAEIAGDVVVVGGRLIRDPAAIVHGKSENILAVDFGDGTGLRSWIHQCLLYGRPLAFAPGLGWAWAWAFTFLALYVLMGIIFRDALQRCVQTVESQPGRTTLAGILGVLLVPVLIVLLCVSVIGIAALPFVAVGLLCMALFGKTVMLMWLGRRITGQHPPGFMGNAAVAVLIGGGVALLLYVIPVLGFLVYKGLGLLGFGAVIYTVLAGFQTRHAEKTAARGTANDAAPAPSPDAHSPPPPPFATPPPIAPNVLGARSAPEQTPLMGAAFPRAGFIRRMAALLIDVLLIGFVMGMLHHNFQLELVVLAAYGACMWKLRASTIGGLILDLQVVRLDGREIDWPTAVVRALGCFLSLAVAGLGFFWIVFDDEGQAWHDKIAGTVVVRVAKGAPLV